MPLQQAPFDDFLDIRLVREEPLRQVAVVSGPDPRVESHLTRIQSPQQLDRGYRQPRLGRDLPIAGLTVQGLTQFTPRTDHARQLGRPIERHPHGPALLRDRGQDRLANPPHGVADELHPVVRIELPGGDDQADVPLLNEVEEAQPLVAVSSGDGDDEAQIRADEAVEGGRVAALSRAGGLTFLGGAQKRITTQFLEVAFKDVGRQTLAIHRNFLSLPTSTRPGCRADLSIPAPSRSDHPTLP